MPRSQTCNMARWQLRKLRGNMKLFIVLFLYFSLLLNTKIKAHETKNEGEATDHDQPTVMVAILVRIKAHVLPFFLHYLEQQDYPKDRMSIWLVYVHILGYTRFKCKFTFVTVSS